MGKFGAFDIIGPRMIGPSSSHTAGAARLARLAWRIARGDVASAVVTLYGSFAETGKGHGTDKALAAGLLGMDSDDKRLRYSLLLAEEAGVDIRFIFSDEPAEHPNSVKIRITGSDGTVTEVEGESIGGGNVMISRLNGMDLEVNGEFPVLIMRYADQPGVISRVTAVLARHDINVETMRVFHGRDSEDACMVVETGVPVSDELLKELYDSADIIKEIRTI